MVKNSNIEMYAEKCCLPPIPDPLMTSEAIPVAS